MIGLYSYIYNMTIIVKNKDTLIFDEFILNVVLEKMDFQKIKLKEIKKHLKEYFHLGNIYYRKDRKTKPITN